MGPRWERGGCRRSLGDIVADIAAPGIPAPASESRAFKNLELIIVILLGIVSVVTAYASFQSSLYDSQMAAAYARGNNEETEAESLYLEGNQQYTQDTQTYAQLTLLDIDAKNGDSGAKDKYDELYYQMVDDDFDAAIQWAQAQNADHPADYVLPFDSDDYDAARFGDYDAEKAQSDADIKAGDQANTYGDELTLYTVLMAITLFLLGIAAVVRAARLKWILIGFGGVIFVVSAVLTFMVPFVAIGS